MAIGHSLVVLGVLACAASDARLSFTGMLVMGGGLGFTGPNIFAFAQTFAGPAAAGKWIGMQNSLGNISGVVVGPLTGLIVDHTGHFGWAFVVCAAVTFVGGISWTRLVGRLEQAPLAGRISSRGGWFRNERGLKLSNGVKSCVTSNRPGSAVMGETSVKGFHNTCLQTVRFRVVRRGGVHTG